MHSVAAIRFGNLLSGRKHLKADPVSSYSTRNISITAYLILTIKVDSSANSAELLLMSDVWIAQAYVLRNAHDHGLPLYV